MSLRIQGAEMCRHFHELRKHLNLRCDLETVARRTLLRLSDRLCEVKPAFPVYQ